MAGKTGGTKTRRQRAEAIMATQARRSRRWNLAIGSAVAVIIVVIAMLVAYTLAHRHTPAADGNIRTPVAAAVMRQVTSVPGKAFAAAVPGGDVAAPEPLSGSPLRADSKPEILYVGGEFCPYCAAERWAVVTALSRFGSFHHLSGTKSSSHDAYPDTPTFSFHGSSYSSPYITLHAYEVSDREQNPLDRLPSGEQTVYSHLSGGSIPFVDIGGRYMLRGYQFSPKVLAGMTRGQIAANLARPGSSVAQHVLGAANLFTAAVCDAAGGHPASVCTAPGVVAAAKTLHPGQ